MTSPHPDHHVTPDPAGTPAQQASELVVDGLLRSLALRGGDDHRRRLDRVVAALHAQPSANPAAATPHPAHLRAPRTLRRRGWLRTAVLAALLLGVGILLSRTGVPGERAALAQVLDAISSMRLPGDRRYEIRVVTSTGAEVNATPDTIDARYPAGLMLIRHHPPFSPTDLFVGRDETGLWSIGRSGRVNRDSPKRDLPPWASLENEFVLDDTVDRLLEALTRSYTLAPAPDAPASASDPTAFHRITASRKARSSRSPERVELWIHPASRAVERIELHWDPALAGTPSTPGSARRDGRRGPPLRVVFQRLETPPFADDWFSPDTHLPADPSHAPTSPASPTAPGRP